MPVPTLPLDALTVDNTFIQLLGTTNSIIDLVNSGAIPIAGYIGTGVFTIDTTNPSTSFELSNAFFANSSITHLKGNPILISSNLTVNSTTVDVRFESKTVTFATGIAAGAGVKFDATPITITSTSTLAVGAIASFTNFVTFGGANTTFNANTNFTAPLLSSSIAYLRTMQFTAAGVISASTANATENDYTPSGLDVASVLQLNPSASALTLTGLGAPAAVTGNTGHVRILYLYNTGAYKITLKSSNSSSSSSNQFAIGGDADYDILPGVAVPLLYSNLKQRWVLLAGGSTSGTFTGPLAIGANVTLSTQSLVITGGANTMTTTNGSLVFANGAVTTTVNLSVIGLANSSVSGVLRLDTLTMSGTGGNTTVVSNAGILANSTTGNTTLTANSLIITGGGTSSTMNASAVATRNVVVGTATANVRFDGVNVYGANTSTSYVRELSGISPTGAITMFAGASAPAGWLLCNGQAINRTVYSALFAVIGTTYGVGDNSTTFNLPDLRQRFPLGLAASGTGATLGETGGAIDHTHTYTQVPNHTHTITDPKHHHSSGNFNSPNAQAGSDVNALSGGGDTGDSFTGITINNPVGGVTTATTNFANPPYLALNFIIKA